MRDSTSLPIIRVQPLTDAPTARKVIFEIGVILASHLALALVVVVALRVLEPF